jgi:hypothetical protein
MQVSGSEWELYGGDDSLGGEESSMNKFAGLVICEQLSE